MTIDIVGLNKTMVEGFKTILATQDLFKDREFCLTSLAPDGKGNLVSVIVDVETSLVDIVVVDGTIATMFNKTVFEGIAKKITTNLVGSAKKQTAKKFDIKNPPLVAQRRRAMYDASIEFKPNKGKLHLLSWSKVMVK